MPRTLAVLLLSTGMAAAGAHATTFRISQIYSNLDGSTQFVELTEREGLDGQHRLAGLTLTSRSRDGVVKRFTLAHDLPSARTANVSITVSTGWLRYASESWLSTEVSSLPARFLATDGGTLDFAGIDSRAYEALPTDGVNALYRDGTVAHATFASNGRCPGACEARLALVQSGVTAIEYYHAGRDHYFISASAPDIDALDSDRHTGWTRTGETFHVMGTGDAAAGLDRPVCRLYLPPGNGDSHFFSASSEECEAARRLVPNAILETNAAFYAALPDPVSGACGNVKWPSTPFHTFACPVYRLWNGRADSNHRYTQSPVVRDQLVARGYVSEGYGPKGVAMCVIVWALWDYC